MYTVMFSLTERSRQVTLNLIDKFSGNNFAKGKKLKTRINTVQTHR